MKSNLSELAFANLARASVTVNNKALKTALAAAKDGNVDFGYPPYCSEYLCECYNKVEMDFGFWCVFCYTKTPDHKSMMDWGCPLSSNGKDVSYRGVLNAFKDCQSMEYDDEAAALKEIIDIIRAKFPDRFKD